MVETTPNPLGSRVSMISMLMWIQLALGVGVASWFRPGFIHFAAVLFVPAAAMITMAIILQDRNQRRSQLMVAMGLALISTGAAVCGVLIWFQDEAVSSRYVGSHVWMTLALWSGIRVRTAALHGIEGSPSPMEVEP